MSKRIHTVRSSDYKEFENKVNFFLELGLELLEKSYEVIRENDDVIYSQVVVYDTNNFNINFFGNEQIRNIRIEENGEWISWYENGQMEESGRKDNLHQKDGLWTFWYENGKMKSSGSYEYSKENGVWDYYNKDGTMKRKTYKDGIPNGEFTYLNENREKLEEGTYKRGSKDGMWTYWDGKGNKKLEGIFRPYSPNGLWTYWDEKGVQYKGEMLQERSSIVKFTDFDGNPIDYKNGEYLLYESSVVSNELKISAHGTIKDQKQIGKWTYWNSYNGCKKKEGTYKGENEFGNPKKDGLWTFWYENGKMEEEGTYKNDSLVGEWNSWYKNGTRRAKTTWKDGNLVNDVSWAPDGKESYVWDKKNGRQDGKWVDWSEDGVKLEEGTYKNGNRDGKWTCYWDEVIANKGNYKDGKPHGKFTWYGERINNDVSNIFKEEEGTYKNGNRDGKWTCWREDGKKELQGFFKDGIEVGIWKKRKVFKEESQEWKANFEVDGENKISLVEYCNGKIIKKKIITRDSFKNEEMFTFYNEAFTEEKD